MTARCDCPIRVLFFAEERLYKSIAGAKFSDCGYVESVSDFEQPCTCLYRVALVRALNNYAGFERGY